MATADLTDADAYCLLALRYGKVHPRLQRLTGVHQYLYTPHQFLLEAAREDAMSDLIKYYFPSLSFSEASHYQGWIDALDDLCGHCAHGYLYLLMEIQDRRGAMVNLQFLHYLSACIKLLQPPDWRLHEQLDQSIERHFSL